MAILFRRDIFIRSPSIFKMNLLNSHNNFLINKSENTSNHFIKKYRPQTTDFAGILRVASATDSERGDAMNVVARDTDHYTLADLRRNNVPRHVAILLDGSRRWHKAHNKPLSYEPFFRAHLLFADLCVKCGVVTATSLVYTLKNLERGQDANDLMFGQFEIFLEENTSNFVRNGIRIRVIGERKVLPQTLQKKIIQVEDATRKCTKLEFMLGVCYAGRSDIVQATKNICENVKNGVIEAKSIDEALIQSELSTGWSQAPEIDLLIRMGGRLRVSGSFIWQMDQAELYFSDICAPEFDELEFIHAMRSFQLRERTFGK